MIHCCLELNTRGLLNSLAYKQISFVFYTFQQVSFNKKPNRIEYQICICIPFFYLGTDLNSGMMLRYNALMY